MVMATVEFTMVITTTPAQLHTAAITMARFTSSDLVDTQVAMAFGASVIPLTQMTPRVSKDCNQQCRICHQLPQEKGKRHVHNSFFTYSLNYLLYLYVKFTNSRF